MKIVVFGATGKTGQHVVEQALNEGHNVVAFVRIPSKLSLKHDRLSVVQGDIQDARQVEKAVAGVDAVVSVLGPSSHKPVFVVSKGIRHIMNAMKVHGVKRLVISAGFGVYDPNDKPGLTGFIVGILLRLMAKYVYEDMKQAVEIVRGSDVDWTIVRVPRLIDALRTGKIKVGYVGNGTGTTISRADMATFMLQQLNDPTFLRKAPAISN